MTGKEQIEAILNYKRISATQLAREIGLSSPQIFYDIKSGKCGISKRLANLILNTYPEISVDWLLQEDGEMKVKIDQQNEYSNKDLLNIIKKKDEQIDRLISILEFYLKTITPKL